MVFSGLPTDWSPATNDSFALDLVHSFPGWPHLEQKEHFLGSHGYENSTAALMPFFDLNLYSFGNSFVMSALTNTFASSKFEHSSVSGCSLTGFPTELAMKPIPFQEYNLRWTFLSVTHIGKIFISCSSSSSSSSAGDHFDTINGIPAIFHMPLLRILLRVSSSRIRNLTVLSFTGNTSIFMLLFPRGHILLTRIWILDTWGAGSRNSAFQNILP